MWIQLMDIASPTAAPQVAAGDMEAVTSAMTDVFTLVGTVITQITSQPILLFCLAAGLVPIGISVFRRLKSAAR